jgi:hypothetical protein
MLNRINDQINEEIMENELAAHDWELNNLIWELSWWIKFFNIGFFKNQPVPLPVLSFQKTRVTTLGSYRIGRNAIGVRENINLNRVHLNRPIWEILATLLHEMVHSYEYLYLPADDRTKSWYHKKGFRFKIASFGILTDNRGCHMGIGDPFVHLLRQHGVIFDKSYGPGMTIEIVPKKKPKGKSKLKKWTCGCTNIRVAISDLEAKCLKCANMFELVS